jgi:hypothetical protein
MKTQSLDMERSDSILGFFIGGVSGMFAWVEFYMLDGSYFIQLAKAGATAFVCGFLGVAAKHLYNHVREKYFRRKKK